MVGINPVSDALGRVNKLEVIPLEELGRPRVDVVVNCSGVFRDLFVNQMNLLDRAIKMAAEQDEPEEMNFVRKHARQQVPYLCPFPTAFLDVFPSGWYGWIIIDKLLPHFVFNEEVLMLSLSPRNNPATC